ncbi:MAG TPA: hypothetical protein VF062_11240 [Candidatus Limnocylindrales bacterium]
MKRAIVIVAAVVCGLAASACSGKPKQPSAVPSFDTTVTSSPSPSPSVAVLTSTPASNPQAGGGGGPAAPTYPKSAKDYVQAMLLAFGKNDKSRMGQLAAQAALLQLASHTGLDPNWTVFVSCKPEGGSHTLCVFRNAHGDVASVKATNSLLGQPAAIVEALIDRTTYASDAAGYAGKFGLAWQNGNTERMRRLSSSSVVSFFSGKTPANSYTPYVSGDTVTMEGLPAGSFSFKLRVAGASLGKANAIVQASNT